MRCLAFAWLALAVGCRPNAAHAVADAAPPSDAAAGEASSPAPVPFPRFSRPVTAVRMKGAVAVVGRDRATRQLASLLLGDAVPAPAAADLLPAPFNDPELLGSSGDIGLLVRVLQDAGSSRVLLRIGNGSDAAARVSDLGPVGIAVCSTADGVYSLAREGKDLKGSFFPLTEAGGVSVGPSLVGRSEATIVCGQHRAFVLLSSNGELRALTWSPDAYDPRPALLPKPPPPSGESESTFMTAMEDRLVITKVDGSTLHTLAWPVEGGVSVWRKADAAVRDGLTLEAVEPGNGYLGLLFIRTVAKAKGCPGAEKTDTIAEVGLVDTASGQFIHAPEAVETWRCGAEPGPFFSGWANGKLVVAWPRGADAACLRNGVRRGGIGYAEVDPHGGRAVGGRIAKPAETIAEAGCDGAKCYAVAVTRGAESCGAEGPESGRLEVIAYPP